MRHPLIAPLESSHGRAVLDLAAGLPEWFTERGRAELAADLERHGGVVAVAADGRLVGFAVTAVRDGIGRLLWLGVDAGRHREGIGRALVEAACDALAADGAEVVDVETVGDGVEYAPYAATRAFYRAVGFVDHRVEQLDDPECPERLTLRRTLRR